MSNRNSRRINKQPRAKERSKAIHKSASLIFAAVAGLGLLGVTTVWLWSGVSADATEITVYKTPTCGCCSAWIDHLEDNGFRVIKKDLRDTSSIKAAHGVKPKLASCHTALVDGYVVEGHVPATDIRRLLAERPPVKGLTVPGMPMGSPGMEGPRKDPYNVLTFDARGKTSVFSRH